MSYPVLLASRGSGCGRAHGYIVVDVLIVVVNGTIFTFLLISEVLWIYTLVGGDDSVLQASSINCSGSALRLGLRAFARSAISFAAFSYLIQGFSGIVRELAASILRHRSRSSYGGMIDSLVGRCTDSCCSGLWFGSCAGLCSSGWYPGRSSSALSFDIGVFMAVVTLVRFDDFVVVFSDFLFLDGVEV